MDVVTDLSSPDRFAGLLLNKQRLAKSDEYYNSIHPTEAAAVDARRAAERARQEAKAKAAADAKSASDAKLIATTQAQPETGGPR
jgi:NADH-quinone oxidoreductase subunit I